MRRHILSVLSVAVSVAVAGWSGVPNPPRAAQAVQRAAEPSAPPTTALVVGRVIDATTGHPIESAVVSVRTRSGLQTDQVRSNANGNFVLRDVPPGTWYVNATRYGHEMYPPGSRVIAVTPVDRVVEVRVRMAKQAVIGGLVTDEAGEPVVGATVRLHSWGPTGFWHPSLSAITDDRGRYRIWTVRPGPQLVSVQPSYASAPAAMLDARDGSDARVAAAARQGLTAAGLSTVARESPGAVEVSGLVVVASGIGASAVTFADGQAQAFRNEFYRAGAVVTLAAGDVADTVDMQLVRVPAGRVSGRVEGDPERIGQLPVQLVNADEPPGLRLRQPIVVARTMTLTDGGFTFPVVPAGRYTLKILKRPAAPSAQIPAATLATSAGTIDVGSTTAASSGRRTLPEGPTFWASVPLAVGSEGVANLVVPLRKGAHMTGRLEFDGVSPRPTPEQINRAFLTVWSDLGEYSSAVIEASGLFRTNGLLPGRHIVRLVCVAGVAGSSWYPKSIAVNGRDVTDEFIDVTDADIGGIVITLTDRPTSVAGVVRDQRGSPVPEAVVVAFPVDPALRDAGAINLWRVRQVAAGPSGAYSVLPLPPGEYFVAAGVDDLTDRWTDPNVLQAMEPAASRVRLAEGAAAHVDLVALTAFPARGGAERDDSVSGPFVDESGADDDGVVGQRDRTVASQAGYGAVEGRVASDAGGLQPVRAATVTLSHTAGRAILTTHTDDQGRFAFARVPIGRYRLTVSKPAHLTVEHGARRPGRPGVPVQIAGGARAAIPLVLPRGSVITGRVMDELGRPITDAGVRALVVRPVGGDLTLGNAAGAKPVEARTDDRGEYRIYGLPPGEYYVGATPPPAANVGRETTDADVAWARALRTRSPGGPGATRQSPAPPPGRTIAQAPSFHPAGSTIGAARPINLAEAEELGGVDVRFRSEPAFTLSGTVIGTGGQPSGGARLTIIPDGLSVPTSRYGSSATPGLSYSYGGVVNVTASAQGTFEIRSLVPGPYTLVARGSSPGTRSVTEWASVPIAMADRDLSSVLVGLRPGATVTVRVASDAETPNRVAALMSLSLTPVAAGAGAITTSGVRPDADGRFTFRGVAPGDYWIGAANLPPPWMPRAATAGGRDVLDEPLTIAATDPDTEVELSLTDRPGQIAGTFTDVSGRPAPDYMVVVFSTDRRHWHAGSRRIRVVRPGTDGRFTTSALPAGEYQLAAVWDAEPDEWFDPEFLARLVPGAIVITLAEGETRTQDIRLAGAGRGGHRP